MIKNRWKKFLTIVEKLPPEDSNDIIKVLIASEAGAGVIFESLNDRRDVFRAASLWLGNDIDGTQHLIRVAAYGKGYPPITNAEAAENIRAVIKANFN